MPTDQPIATAPVRLHPVAVNHYGRCGPLADIVTAAIQASCPPPRSERATPVWDGRQWSVRWYSADRCYVSIPGASQGFNINGRQVSAPASAVGDFDVRPGVVKPEMFTIAAAVRDALADAASEAA